MTRSGWDVKMYEEWVNEESVLWVGGVKGVEEEW